jgi:hypothetical protein
VVPQLVAFRKTFQGMPVALDRFRRLPALVKREIVYVVATILEAEVSDRSRIVSFVGP